ncbi:peptidase family M13 [Oesophagostomum dentatum]|uniref:Peptidase family M13 n=1 Tax=Oesophagostomum dentatum TaxID=61180 RepID=A0A0B1TBZ9_OESDE|nr:peptidase family M13 [Oesophagostomum dentatum]
MYIHEMTINLVNSFARQPNPVKTMAKYYEKCVSSRMNWDNETKDGAVIMKSIKRLAAGKKNYEDRTKFPFYMLYQNEAVKENFSADGLAFLLGNSIGIDNVASLVTVFVDGNWKDPYGKDGYSLFIDQPTTIIPYKYHIKAWKNAKESAKNSTAKTMRLLANSQGITLDKGKLEQDIDEVLEFDHLLATKYSTDDTTRRSFERSFNTMTLYDLQNRYGSITWRVFIEEVTQLSPEIQERLLQVVGEKHPYQYIVAEPGMLLLLNDLFSDKTSFSTRTVVNYIYTKLVLAYSDFLPKTTPLPDLMLEPPLFAGPRHIQKVKKGFKRQQFASRPEAEMSCVGETTWNMMVKSLRHANARLFIDKVYPTEASRKELKQRVGEIVSFVSVGFRSMIDQLNWMSPVSKAAAYKKIDHIVTNVGYPEWITDDAQLVKAHKALDIVDNDNYFTMVEKLRQWKIKNTWNMLFGKTTDREKFDIPAGTTNAWYQPQANSITLPAAILHKPFYDPSWPAALNFGCLGVVAGHEITHGFDDEGVQWDETGILNGWMDSSSMTGFRQMADCVVDQYNHFCPLNKTNFGATVCVDGAMTQGENIADSGGVQSAFRAYRNYINLKGTGSTATRRCATGIYS